jgi:hypothetical protein
MRGILVGLLALIGVVFLLAWLISYTMAYPRYRKLADCDSFPISFTFRCPGGSGYLLGYGVRGVTNLDMAGPLIFDAWVEVFDGSNAVLGEAVIARTPLVRPSWLDEEKGVAGVAIVRADGKASEFNQIMERGKTYRVSICSSNNVPNREIWLMWHQSEKDGFLSEEGSSIISQQLTNEISNR